MAEDTATYVALKRMKIQELEPDGTTRLEDGRPVMRLVSPGDLIPEANSWRNLWREVKAGRVGLQGTALTGPALADSMRRQTNQSSPASVRGRPKKTAKKSSAKKAASKKTQRRRRAPDAELTNTQKAAAESALYNAGAGDGTPQIGDLPPIPQEASETME